MAELETLHLNGFAGEGLVVVSSKALVTTGRLLREVVVLGDHSGLGGKVIPKGWTGSTETKLEVINMSTPARSSSMPPYWMPVHRRVNVGKYHEVYVNGHGLAGDYIQREAGTQTVVRIPIRNFIQVVE